MGGEVGLYIDNVNCVFHLESQLVALPYHPYYYSQSLVAFGTGSIYVSSYNRFILLCSDNCCRPPSILLPSFTFFTMSIRKFSPLTCF